MNKNENDSAYNKALSKEWADWVETSDGRWNEIFPRVKKWVEGINSITLVDIGCGQGICSTLINNDVKYIGIDLSKDLIERAQNLYRAPNREFILGSAYNIPLENEFTDVAMSIWVWSHLTDLKQAAKEMFRILKSTGNFLIITANPETYEVRKTYYKSFKDYGGYLVGTFNLGGGKILTDTTLQLHTKDQMLNAITEAGLGIDGVEAFGLKEDDPRGMYIEIRGHKR